jgi:hypothetical protein
MMNCSLRESKPLPRLLIVLTLGLAFATADAVTFSVGGSFARDDQVAFIPIDLNGRSLLSVTSIGYAGGVDANGVVAPRGGFDTMLFLYNSAGTLLAQSDDGTGVPTDPVTGLASDAAFSIGLGTGAYTLALTQYDNFAVGNLAAGFSRSGSGNFTPGLNGSCSATAFCDSVGSARTSRWTINIATVSAVPEPPVVVAMLAGLVAIARVYRRRRP